MSERAADLGPVPLLGREGHVHGVSDGEAGHGALGQRDDLVDGVHHAAQAGVALQRELAAHLQTREGAGFYGNSSASEGPSQPEPTWLEYWTTPTLVAFSPTSRVLRMSIRNFLMVSNSCGRTLRELSMRKTRSTGPDLHFCSGPEDGRRVSAAGLVAAGDQRLSQPPTPGCRVASRNLLWTRQQTAALRCNVHIFTP